MIDLTLVRQILNLIRDMIFVMIYSGHPDKQDQSSSKRRVIGYLFLFSTLLMYSAESSSIFSSAATRTLFRIVCYFAYLYLVVNIKLSLALYDALFLNTICTITHNFFLTPLTRPILLNTVVYVANPLLNWLICFLIVNVVVVLCDFIVYRLAPINRVTTVSWSRIVSLCAFMVGSIYLNNTLRTITDVNLKQITEFSIYAIISQMTLFCCVIFLEVIQWKTEMQLEAHMDAFAARAMLENIEKQSASDDKVRQIRHDLKNHLNTIYNLVNKDKKDECLQYIQQLVTDYTQPSIMIHTGNHILDSIISQKLNTAAEKNIMTSFSADFSCLGFLSNTDACVVFANLLDNAIEAAEKIVDPEKRYIDIRSSIKGNQYICRIENSYDGVIIRQNNIFRTTKNDQYYHGIGLRSVLNTIKKYDGLLLFDTDQEALSFKAILIFPIITS